MLELDFLGKGDVYAHHLTVPFQVLAADTGKSCLPKGGKPDLSGNLIIEGDNLKALKSLLPRYEGKVNCIYIDPPYNTGNEGWAYNDNVNSPMITKWMGKTVDGDDQCRHDKWLCMMWPRLQLLKDLLADDGVIFISIDDNEQHRLRSMMDEIFGEENFVGNIGWESKTKTQNTKDSFNKLQPKIEHILCYSKGTKMRFNLIQIDAKQYPEKDKNGEFRYALIEQMSALGIRSRDSMVFPILGINPQHNKQWKIGTKMVQKFEHRGDLLIKNGMPHLKMRPDDERTEKTDPFWGFFSKEKGTTERAKAELSEILESPLHGFETVKPVSVVRQLLFHATDHESIILDSFAGSGTTAHAVLALNKEDSGTRKFILVECENKIANKITAERVRRAIKGVKGTKDETLRKGLGGSFTYCTLGKELSEDKMLTGESLPDYETLATHIFWTATGETLHSFKSRDDWFIGESARFRVYLVYKPDPEFLKSNDSALTGDLAEKIAKRPTAGKKILVYAPSVFVGRKELAEKGIVFCQLPWTIHQRLGA